MKTIEVFKRHIKYIHKCKRDYIYLFYVINTLCATIIPFLTLFFTRYIIDSIGLFSFNEILIKLVIIISILLLLTIITIYSNTVSSAIFISLRVNEFKFTTKLYMDMDFRYVEDSKFNDKFFLCTRCLNGDNNGFQGLFNQVYILLPLVMQVLVYTVLLGIFNPLIVLLVLLSFTISLSKEHLISRYLSKFLKKNEKHYKHLDNLFNTTFNEKYAKDIRLFSINRLLRKKYKEEVDSINSYSRKCEIRDFYYSLVDLLFVFIRDVLAYYIVIKAYLDNNLTIGNLTLYLGFIVGMSQVLRTIANESKRLNRQIVELKEYYSFLEEYNFVTNKGELKAIDKKIPLEIEFKNVSFKYPGSEKFVLSDLSFKIYKGEKLAIIGDNGAGKSTIIKLISGLYEPTSGEILINGINQKEFDKYEYYNMFSTVFQDVNVYPGTILENVCGTDKNKDARDKAIDALTKVGLDGKINSLPKGYDTDLTHVFEEDGINLSGGETQKLCIARALYKDSNVVILDEPTSALDALAEASIYESFSSLVLNKTAIYISHRLSSTKFCDHIALFTKDGLIEYGNHESLMDKKGLYYEMFMIQGKYYKAGGLNEK